MAVLGRSSSNAPADLAAAELFAVDAYATEFDARVTEVGAVRVAGTESKGKDNKRIRLEVLAAREGAQRMESGDA